MARGRGNKRGTQSAAAPRQNNAAQTAEVAEDATFDGRTAAEAIKRAQIIVWRFEERRRELMMSMGADALADAKDLIDLDTKAAGIIPAREQRTLVAAAQAGDEQSKRVLLACNQRALYDWARPFQNQGLALEDLVQHANEGMMDAIARFDHAEKASFLTYARWWVRHAINRALQEEGGQMAIPGYLDIIRKRTQRAVKALEARGVGSPSRQQVHDEVQAMSNKPVPVEHIDSAMTLLGRRFSSLDAEVNDESDSSRLGSMVADERIDMDEGLRSEQVLQAISASLDELSPLQRTIITRKFGLDGHEPITNVALQDELGMTRGALYHHTDRALETLRPHLEAAGVDAELLA